MLPEVLITLSYVVSQITYRWLPEPTIVLEKDHSILSEEANLEGLSLSDWEEMIKLIEEVFIETAPYVTKFVAGDETKRKLLAKVVYQHLQACKKNGAQFIICTDPRYPKLLRTIPDPPLAINVMGDSTILNHTMVAVVGSRKASCTAIRESFMIGKELSRHGYVVVSGGAYGCDIAAHQGVLKDSAERGIREVKAVVVFAGGLEKLYPRGNIATFKKMRERSAVFLSERLWSMISRPMDFPVRNRIISGLSESVFIMQAGENSGAGITAKLALDQGREVFTLKHEEDDIRAIGNQKLIDEGAIFFDSAADFAKVLTNCASRPIG